MFLYLEYNDSNSFENEEATEIIQDKIETNGTCHENDKVINTIQSMNYSNNKVIETDQDKGICIYK